VKARNPIAAAWSGASRARPPTPPARPWLGWELALHRFGAGTPAGVLSRGPWPSTSSTTSSRRGLPDTLRPLIVVDVAAFLAAVRVVRRGTALDPLAASGAGAPEPQLVELAGEAQDPGGVLQSPQGVLPAEEPPGGDAPVLVPVERRGLCMARVVLASITKSNSAANQSGSLSLTLTSTELTSWAFGYSIPYSSARP